VYKIGDRFLLPFGDLIFWGRVYGRVWLTGSKVRDVIGCEPLRRAAFLWGIPLYTRGELVLATLVGDMGCSQPRQTV